MATKTKNKGLHKDGSRSKEGFSSKKDGCAEHGRSPVGMNGDLDDEPQLWIHDPEGAVSLEEKDRKRISHNVLERKRKDKIKRWISTIRDLLPKFSSGMEKPSHGDIMEKACSYIRELQDKNEKLLQDRGSEVQAEEIQILKKELTEVQAERDRLLEIIKNAGLSTLLDPSHQWKARNQSKPDSTATNMDCEPSCSSGSGDTFVPDISSSSQKDDESKLAKSKRKNTVSFQLEQTKIQQQQQQQLQEAAAAQAMAGAMFGPGFMGNGGMPLMNPLFPGLGQQVLANQNLLMNSGFQNPGTVVMNGNGQVILPMSSTGTGNSVGGGVQPPGMIFPAGDKNLTANGLGLLQLAMQDAGIGPAQSDSSRQPSPACSTSDALQQSKPVSASSSGSDTPNSVSGSAEDLNPASALQTLASVASNTQNAAVGSMMSGMPQNQPSVVSQSSLGVTNTTSAVNSVMSLGQQPSYTQMMQQGNMVVNMPMVNPGQTSATGMIQNGALGGYGMGNFMINQNGQMIVINDQGMPMLTGLPGVQPAESQQQQLPVQVPKPEKSKSSKKSKTSTSMSNSASAVLPSAQEQSEPGAVNISLVSSKSDQTIINSANTITVTASQTQPSIMPPNMSHQQNQMALFAQQNTLLQTNGLQSLGLQGQPQVSMPSAQNMYQQQQLGGQLAVNNQLIQTQNPGIAMPVSQNGNLLTLNTMPSQPNQLPTALILPNGQIIPVVTNAQTVNTQQPAASGSMQILPNGGNTQIQYPPQIQQRVSMPSTVLTGIDPNSQAAATQMIIGPGGVPQQIQQAPQQQLFQQQIQLQQQFQQQALQQPNMGLLLTTTASNQIVSTPTTNCASLSTSVIPTSSTQSVMSTHVQASGTATNVVQTANSVSSVQDTSSVTSLVSGQDMDSQSKISSQIQIQAQPDGVKSLQPSVTPVAPPTPAPSVPQTPGLVQATGSNAPVLLTVPVNGQQMNVLIDPMTMQVLATLPTTQATPLISTTTAATAQAPTPTTQTSGSSSKKSGKKNQRAIYPKPSSKNVPTQPTDPPVPPPPAPPTSISPASNTTSTSAAVTSITQPAATVTSTTFTESKTNSSTSSTDTSTSSVAASAASAATDILAKAAESIFSPSPSEISPMASFYNPANEDNPLHIDTSAGDGEEDSSSVSPVKPSHDTVTASANKKGEEMAPPETVPPVKAAEPAPVLPSPSPAPAPAPEQTTVTPTKKNKSKSKSKNKETTPENVKSESKKSSSKKKKQSATAASAAPAPPAPALTVPEEDSTKVVNLPESIEFSASQLSDVLDQVESFGSTVEPTKKKSRKGKSDVDGSEPANKKRKKNSGKDKEVPPAPPQQPHSNKAMSIYDFEDDSPPAVSPSPSRRSLGPLHNQNTTPVTVPPPAPPPPPPPQPQPPPPTPVSKSLQVPPVPKEGNTAAENFDLLDTVLSQALPLPTESSTTQTSESVKSPFTSPNSNDTNSKMETSLSQESCVQSFTSSVAQEPANTVQTSSLSKLSHPDSQLQSKPSPITASSSDDPAQKTSSATPNMTPKSDLMENAVSSSMLSPASAGSAQGQMSDMVAAAISSSGVDALAELTASPAASPSPGALIMGSSPNYPSSIEQPTPQQQQQPQPQPQTQSQQPTQWQSTPSLQQSPSQSLQVSRPPSHPAQTMPGPPPLQQTQQQTSQNQNSRQTSQIHPQNQPANQSMPAQQNMTNPINKPGNLASQQQINCSTQKSNTMQQSPSSTTMVSPPAPRPRGGQESQSSFPGKGQGQVSSYQRSPCQEVLGPTDQMFNSPPHVSSVPKLTHPPTSQMNKPVNNSESSVAQRSRNSIYSADNFVQPSRNSSNDSRAQTSSTNVATSGNTFGRLPTDSSNESFNFTSIGLNLTSSTTTNSMPESLTNASNAATPFSFSLTPVTSTTVTTTASSNSGPVPSHPHHSQFSFYPLHPPVSQQTSAPPVGSGSNSQGGQPNMLSLGMDLRLDGNGPQSRHPSNNVQGQGPFFGLMDMNSRASNMPQESSRHSMQEKSAHGNFGVNVSGQKRHANIPSSRPVQSSQPLDHNSSTNQRSPHVNSNSGSYYPPNFQTCTASLHTAPLHHPPAQSGESSRLAHPRTPYEPPFPGASQSMGPMPFGPNRYDTGQGPFNRSCNPPQSFEHSSNQTSDSRKSTNQSGSKSSKQPPQQTPPLSHPQSQPQSVISASPQSHTPTNSHNSCSSQPPPAQQMSQSVSQVRSQKRKQSKKTSKQQQQQQPNYNCDMDTNLSHSIFDSNQGIASYFQIPNLPPSPSRNMSNEGPSFLPGNLFGPGGRPISNSGPGMHKNAELGPPFNSLFPPARAQNGLGLNFQHTFGMNPGNPSNAPQLGSHSGSVSLAPHMPNFSLGNLNFLSDVNSGGQNDSLNISPIKFPHGNTILPPQAGMDHNSLQHAHQGSSLYHQRGQPPQPHVIHNTMSINSILGHNPHGFDVRPMGQAMNSSVTPPFHGAGHPGSFSMPPLNLHAMHEH